MRDIELKPGEKIEDLQNGYRVIQHPEFFSFGTDAVLLAHFAASAARGHVVDFGTGCGIIPLLLCARCKDIHVTGIEVQHKLADMARRSVCANELESRIRIVCADLKDARFLELQGVDMVVSNPPYEKAGAGKQNASVQHNIAKREVKCTLDDVLDAAAKLLRTGGRLCLIYRTERLAELLAKMRAIAIEPKRIQLVAPSHGKAPNFALVEGRKNAREGLVFLPTLEIYEADGGYTAPLKKIYGREG